MTVITENPLFAELLAEVTAVDDPVVFAEEILGMDYLFPEQKYVLRKFYERKESLNADELGDFRFRNLILICGMRGGKTFIASIIELFEIYKMISLGDYCKHYELPPGSEIFFINVATAEKQSKDTIFAAVLAKLEYSPWFQRIGYKVREGKEIHFRVGDGKLIVRAEHSNSDSLAGKTAKVVLFDETARFKETKGKASGEFVWSTLTKAVKTFGEQGRVVSVSSIIHANDLQMKQWNLCGVQIDKTTKAGEEKEVVEVYPEGNPSIQLGMRYATWDMNPKITRESLIPEYKLNPETAQRDYASIPTHTKDVYYREPWRIDLRIEHSLPNIPKLINRVIELNEKYDSMMGTGMDLSLLGEEIAVVEAKLASMVKPKTPYVMGADPAFKKDAFGLSLVHFEKPLTTVIDMAHRFIPKGDEGQMEVDIDALQDFIFTLLRFFPVQAMAVDTWQYPKTTQSIARKGVRIKQNFVKFETQEFFKEMIYDKDQFVDICPSDILIKELKELELLRGVKVDHPKEGSKDVADAVINAVWIMHNEKIGKGQRPRGASHGSRTR